MPPLDLPMMPMAQAAHPLDLGAPKLPPLSLSSGPPPAGPLPMTPDASMPPAAPASAVAQESPYSVKLQADGTSVYYLPGPKGDGSDDIVLGVNRAPKLPPALQPPDAGDSVTK